MAINQVCICYNFPHNNAVTVKILLVPLGDMMRHICHHISYGATSYMLNYIFTLGCCYCANITSHLIHLDMSCGVLNSLGTLHDFQSHKIATLHTLHNCLSCNRVSLVVVGFTHYTMFHKEETPMSLSLLQTTF